MDSYQEQMYATSKSNHAQSPPGSLEQANALEAMCEALYGLIGELRGQVVTLTARLDANDQAAYEAGAGENTEAYDDQGHHEREMARERAFASRVTSGTDEAVETQRRELESGEESAT